MTCSERSFTMKLNVQDRLSITMCAAGVAGRNNDIEVAVTCCVSLQCSIECTCIHRVDHSRGPRRSLMRER